MANISGSSGSPIWFYFKKFQGTLPDAGISGGNLISEYFFAGMLFAGPEKENDGVQDVHLGEVINREYILSFLKTLKESNSI